MKLIRLQSGDYRLGNFRLRGMATRMDGRQGSRINTWMVSDAKGKSVAQYTTLALAVSELKKKLA